MNGNAYATREITMAGATAQLAMMLTNCTDERLEGFTADNLAAMYRVRPRAIAAMLEAERERRKEWRRRHG
jgi:hypothetical protein